MYRESSSISVLIKQCYFSTKTSAYSMVPTSVKNRTNNIHNVMEKKRYKLWQKIVCQLRIWILSKKKMIEFITHSAQLCKVLVTLLDNSIVYSSAVILMVTNLHLNFCKSCRVMCNVHACYTNYTHTIKILTVTKVVVTK